MDRRGHSASSRGPGRAGPSTSAPAGVTRPPGRGSRGGERLSPTRPGSRRAGRTNGPVRRSAERASTPATVWPTGPDALDPDAAWPVRLVDTIVTSFTAPGARVVLLTTDPATDTGAPVPPDVDAEAIRALPAAIESTADPGAADPHRTVGAAATGDRDGELRAAIAAVRRAGRTVVRVSPGTLGSGHGTGTGRAGADLSTGPADTAATVTGRGPVPYWADVFTPPAANDTHSVTATGGPAETAHRDGRTGVAQDEPLADLVIASVDPHGPLDDHFGVACARLLRVGGILAVITHSDWSAGRLVDPTGAIVAAAQNADLLYLQHIVALHTPIRDGRLAPPRWQVRRTGPATGAPVAHDRTHGDVLVFSQPHDHQSAPYPDRHDDHEPEADGDHPAVCRSPAAAAFDGGVIR